MPLSLGSYFQEPPPPNQCGTPSVIATGLLGTPKQSVARRKDRPVRYRLMILAKVSYGVAAIWLFSAGRIGPFLLNLAAIDLVFAGLFLASYLKTSERQPT